MTSSLPRVPLAMLAFAVAAGPAQAALCPGGVAVEILGPAAPSQGDLLMVEVRPARPLESVAASWAGQDLHFWKDGDHVHRALLGVDLAHEPGPAALTLALPGDGDAPVECRIPLTIAKGDFEEEPLTLPRRYVEFNARDAARAKRDEERLAAVFERVSPRRLWTGGFLVPVTAAEASGNFGKRRILNGQPRSPHGGEDFGAPRGTPVRAAQRGRVVLAGALFLSGNTVVVDHGLGLYTLYAHLQSIAVKRGQLVTAGARLGRVGATGRATGPHLHWTVRVGASRVDPLDLVSLPAPPKS